MKQIKPKINKEKRVSSKKHNIIMGATAVFTTLCIMAIPIFVPKIYSKKACLSFKKDKAITSFAEDLGIDENNFTKIGDNYWRCAIPNNGIKMMVDSNLYNNYKSAFDFTCNYLNSVFSIINPKIKFKVISKDVRETNGLSLSLGRIYYFESDLDDGVLAHTQPDYSIFYINEDFIPSCKIDINNKNYSELYTSSNFYITEVVLHETLHALGLSHIEKSEDGNLMSSSLDIFCPLVLSTKELKSLIAIYGDSNNIDYYKNLIEWYDKKYQESKSKLMGLICDEENLHITRGQMAEKTISCFFDMRDFQNKNCEELIK